MSPIAVGHRGGGGTESERARRAKHHTDTPAPAPRTAQPLRDVSQRKVPPPGADQGFEVEILSIVARPPVLHALAAIVETADMDDPTQIPGFAQCLDSHADRMSSNGNCSLRRCSGLLSVVQEVFMNARVKTVTAAPADDVADRDNDLIVVGVVKRPIWRDGK